MGANNISKVRTNAGLKKDDGEVYECVSIGGVIIDLRNVSPGLRQRYHAANRAVARHEDAQTEMKNVADAILAEQAIKVAPRARGNDAVAKLLGCKR